MHETAELNVQHNKGEQENNTSEPELHSARARAHTSEYGGGAYRRKEKLCVLLIKVFQRMQQRSLSLFTPRLLRPFIMAKGKYRENVRATRREEIWRNTGRC